MRVPDISAPGGARRLYKTSIEQQLTFYGFNQSCEMKFNPKDEYVLLADMIDWAAVEDEYSALFKSKRSASPTRSTTSASRSQSSWRTCSESGSRFFTVASPPGHFQGGLRSRAKCEMGTVLAGREK